MNAEEKNALAGEYVLGTLSEVERISVERSATTDPELAAAIKAWEGRLSPLASAAPAVDPPPAVWDRIAAATAPTPLRVVTGGAASRDEALRAEIDRNNMDRLKQRVRTWRWTATISGALAAGLAAVVVAGPFLDGTEPATQGDRYVAVVDRGELPALLVDVDTTTGVIAVVSLAAEAPPDKSYELWYITEGQAALSLGLINEVGGRITVPIDQVAGFNVTEATFAITEEPVGGAPEGVATGPIVYIGTLVPAPMDAVEVN
jgi:anti-sigma-K factor RskA